MSTSDEDLLAPPDSVELLLGEALQEPMLRQAEAIARLGASHPHLAVDLERRFAALVELGLAGSISEAPTLRENESAILLADTRIPDVLGGFDLRERLGGGGMGVVYRAHQRDLDRDVALKLIRPEFLYFPGSRERFRREARAIAQLQHPGIVPLYSAGEENGLPYFAMELIHGCTLAQVIRFLTSRPLEKLDGSHLADFVQQHSKSALIPARRSAVFQGRGFEVIARWVRQIALALEHAHARNILHRDVKPSNIMVTPTGRAMLLDFGLARSDDTSTITRTGSALGSLPYMSPEQCRGDMVDERTDIYSLGVTFYELLSGKSPYLEPSAELTRQRILEGHPLPPRRNNPSIPADIETVCLVAMERDQSRRYATASAFAEDLAAALENRPIHARRPGWLHRVRQRVVRSPGATAATILAVMLFLVAPWAFWYREQQTHATLSKLLSESKRNEALAREQRGWALNNLRVARSAVDTFLTEVADNVLFEQPRMVRTRRELLEAALSFSESLLSTKTTDPASRIEVSLALARAGNIQARMGELATSWSSYERAVAMLDQLAAEEDQREVYRLLATVLHGFGAARIDALQPTAALPLLLRADALLRWMNEQAASDPSEQRLRALNAHRLVNAWRTLGELDKAREALGEAMAWADAVRSQPHQPAADLLQAGRIMISEGILLAAMHDQGAAGAFRRALEIFARARADDPSRISLQHAEAHASASLGRELYATGNVAEATAILERATQQFRELVFISPDTASLEIALARTLSHLAETLAGDDARRAFEEAARILRRVSLSSPDLADAREQLATTCRHAALFELRDGDHEAALKLFEFALTTRRALFDADRSDPSRAGELGAELCNMGSTLARMGRFEESLIHAEEAVERLAVIPQAMPEDVTYLGYTWSALQLRIMVLAELHREDEAVRAAIAMGSIEFASKEPYYIAAKTLGLVLTRKNAAGDGTTGLTEGARLAAIESLMRFLEEAARRGYRNEDEVRRAPWFQPIAEHPRFGALLNRLTAKAEAPLNEGR